MEEEHGEEYKKEDQSTSFRQRRRAHKRSFPTAISRRGHRKTPHSKRNTATKWGGLKDEHDLAREGLLYVIQRRHIEIFLG